MPLPFTPSNETGLYQQSWLYLYQNGLSYFHPSHAFNILVNTFSIVIFSMVIIFISLRLLKNKNGKINFFIFASYLIFLILMYLAFHFYGPSSQLLDNFINFLSLPSAPAFILKFIFFVIILFGACWPFVVLLCFG